MAEQRAAAQRHPPRDSHDRNRPDSLWRRPPPPLSERVRRLVNEMETCLAANREILLSTAPHREITEALRVLVYGDGDEGRLKIRYGDGSMAQRRDDLFPVHQLWLAEHPSWDSTLPTFNIGTLTFRHLGYDEHVDLFLIRDRETRALNNASIEALAFGRMTEVLEDPLLAGPSQLTVYQTGLEPIVIGLYRALVDHLRKRREEGLPPLVVRPAFYADDEESSVRPGALWA